MIELIDIIARKGSSFKDDGEMFRWLLRFFGYVVLWVLLGWGLVSLFG
jgi:hypothetical protein